LHSVIPTIVGTALVEAGLPLADVPALIGALVAQNATAVAEVPGITQSILLVAEGALQDSYAEGFRKVYLVSIAFGGAAVIASLFLGDIRKYMVSRVAVDIH
jgi:Fungal trichothecene efflux pump (TRI12)